MKIQITSESVGNFTINNGALAYLGERCSQMVKGLERTDDSKRKD